MMLLVCTDGELMDECDDTASLNDESPSENADSGVEPNYSLSVDSYSDSSNSNSSSLYEVNICVLNGKKCRIDNKERNHEESCEEFGLKFNVDQLCVGVKCMQTASHFDDIKRASIEEINLEGKLQN
jgi:hypothetical protein